MSMYNNTTAYNDITDSSQWELNLWIPFIISLWFGSMDVGWNNFGSVWRNSDLSKVRLLGTNFTESFFFIETGTFSISFIHLSTPSVNSDHFVQVPMYKIAPSKNNTMCQNRDSIGLLTCYWHWTNTSPVLLHYDTYSILLVFAGDCSSVADDVKRLCHHKRADCSLIVPQVLSNDCPNHSQHLTIQYDCQAGKSALCKLATMCQNSAGINTILPASG